MDKLDLKTMPSINSEGAVQIATAIRKHKPTTAYDYNPTGITPKEGNADALSSFEISFASLPNIVKNKATVRENGGEVYNATLSMGEGNVVKVDITDGSVSIAGNYTLTIPVGSIGDEEYKKDQTTGHCNPELTYSYTILSKPSYDYNPTGITPEEGTVATLSSFELNFASLPNIVKNTATVRESAGTIYNATISAGDGNVLNVDIDDESISVNGSYTLTIPSGSIGDAEYAEDQSKGHCNPELTYSYTITVE